MTSIEQAAAWLDEIARLVPSEKVRLIKQIEAARPEGEDSLTPGAILQEAFRLAYDATMLFHRRAEVQIIGDGSGANWHDVYFTLLAIAKRQEDHTGRYEIEYALRKAFANATEIEAQFLHKILFKDLRCGMDVKSVNKAYYFGFVPEYACALAKPLDRRHVTFPILAEVKYNGARLQAHVNRRTREVEFLSRKGLPIDCLGHLATPCLLLADKLAAKANSRYGGSVVLDGELMWERFGKGARRASTSMADFVVYDWLYSLEFEDRAAYYPQAERTKRLLTALEEVQHERLKAPHGRICNSWAEVDGLFNEVVSDGGEGLVLKRLDAKYQFKRSWAWQKYKPVTDVDLRVIGLEEGEGKYAGMLGAIVVSYNGRRVKVGTGFDDAMRAEVWNNKSAYLGAVVEIQYREVTPEGSLAHTNFVRWRDDK